MACRAELRHTCKAIREAHYQAQVATRRSYARRDAAMRNKDAREPQGSLGGFFEIPYTIGTPLAWRASGREEFGRVAPAASNDGKEARERMEAAEHQAGVTRGG